MSVKSKKSINIQLVILFCLFLVYVCNLLYNWDYFKQYSGPETTMYFISKYIEYIFRYSVLISILLLIYCSFIKKPSDKA